MIMHHMGILKKVLGEDVIVVNPTIFRGVRQRTPCLMSSERTPYDIYSVLSEDCLTRVRLWTPRSKHRGANHNSVVSDDFLGAHIM